MQLSSHARAPSQVSLPVIPPVMPPAVREHVVPKVAPAIAPRRAPPTPSPVAPTTVPPPGQQDLWIAVSFSSGLLVKRGYAIADHLQAGRDRLPRHQF